MRCPTDTRGPTFLRLPWEDPGSLEGVFPRSTEIFVPWSSVRMDDTSCRSTEHLLVQSGRGRRIDGKPT